MELRHLRYLVAVAQEGSVVRAARRLRIAQPALSRQIRALERELGGALFDRSTRNLTLNDAGTVCLETAREILDEATAALEQARLTSQGMAGRCVLSAATVPLRSGFAATIVTRVNAVYPAIDVVVHEAALGDQWEALRRGTADIALGLAPAESEVELVWETQRAEVADAIAVARNHRLADRRSIRLAELNGEPFVWVRPEFSSNMRQWLREEFANRGCRLLEAAAADSATDIISVVGAGQGWALVPRTIVERLPSNIVAISLDDAAYTMSFARIWRRTERRPVVHTVLDLLRQFAANSVPQREGGSPRAPRGPSGRVTTANLIDRVELRHLRYFVAVVDEGSIGRAAERLGLTQPALSRQLRDLERAADAQLVERETRGVTTTQAGAVLYQRCQRMLDKAARLCVDVVRAQRAMAGTCSVGVVPTNLATRLLSAGVEECAALSPKVRLLTTYLNTPELETALREGRIDVAIVHAFPRPAGSPNDFDRRRLVDDVIDSALVAERHPLAGRHDVALDALSDTPFLFISRDFDPALHDLVLRAFAALEFQPCRTVEHDGLQTLWSLVAQGRGWCLGWSSQRTDPPSGLIAVRVRDLALPWGTDVIARSGDRRWTVTAAVAAFQHAVARVAAPAARAGVVPAALGVAGQTGRVSRPR